MKNDILKIISKNIATLLELRSDVSHKALSELSEISYSTLAPILRGERDFRITNLVALAKALGCTPNDLMAGLFADIETGQLRIKKKPKPRYMVSFITTAGLSHCQLYDIKERCTERRILPFSLFCTDSPSETLEKIKSSIVGIVGTDINFDEVFLYLSILSYEHVFGRQKLLDSGSKEFAEFVMEPDWMSIHKSVVANNNGMLITINNGFAISYSNDSGKTVHKIQGYSFPISDEAGNIWLGCEAIKHAINVVEKIEGRSLLSDKILSRVNSDLDLLATKVYENPEETYIESAKIVKELAHTRDKAHELVKQGFHNIWERVKKIDQSINNVLPIYLAGDLAYLYEEFVPKDRLVQTSVENFVDLQFDYATYILDERFNAASKKQQIK